MLILDVSWENFVHERFHDQHGKTAKRQRNLVLALSERGGDIPRSQLRGLTPDLLRRTPDRIPRRSRETSIGWSISA
jgi:hypothetical protein